MSETVSVPDRPSIFISYSWDDEGHKTWVRNLATKLTESGVDVALDQWQVAPVKA